MAAWEWLLFKLSSAEPLKNFLTTTSSTLLVLLFEGCEESKWVNEAEREQFPHFKTLTCATCWNPVRKIGKKIPVTLTWSPGWAVLVFSPCKTTVMLRGMFPTGT